MAKERDKRGADGQETRSAADYYKLHTDAVNDLVNADESNSPEVPEEELRRYRSGPRLRLADWAKLLFVKMWFAGSVCFFIFWGLGGYVSDRLDLLLIFGIALGVVTDLLTNNALRFLAKSRGGADRWMMFPRKGYLSFPLNILYAFLPLLCVDMLYTLLNLAITAAQGADARPLGVGPILFGVFYTGFDLLFILIKRTLCAVVADAKRSAR
ncbi:MAG: hypothetical protein E7425_03555 [Ruminococcaceae bacterium]|nr:hypothetical protein [Oscillospiraceae bacterium]